jgi:hypothetical protein
LKTFVCYCAANLGAFSGAWSLKALTDTDFKFSTNELSFPDFFYEPVEYFYLCGDAVFEKLSSNSHE